MIGPIVGLRRGSTENPVFSASSCQEMSFVGLLCQGTFCLLLSSPKKLDVLYNGGLDSGSSLDRQEGAVGWGVSRCRACGGIGRSESWDRGSCSGSWPRS